MNQVISFYIPRVSVSYTAENIKHIFRVSGIGEVKRVDFTSIVSRENMASNSNTSNEYLSVFLHIAYMYDTDIAKVVMKYITTGTAYKFWVKPGLFWLILKNTNPVPDTIQNIHQIAENARLLEERVVKQEEHIARQSAEITRLQETVYQIIGTVFNHKEQSDNIYGHVNNMYYGKFYTKRWLYDENDNGDEDEQSQSSNSSTNMPALDELEDGETTCSDSTHSSMPSLTETFHIIDTDDDSYSL